MRGDGGYIVAAPSPHPSSRRYQWTPGQPAPTPWPAWTAAHPNPTRAPSASPEADRTAGYVRAAVDGETARIARSQPGARNATLNRAAFSLGTVGADVLNPETAASALQAAANAARIPSREAERTIRSGLDAGRHRPRPPDGTSRLAASDVDAGRG